MDVRIIIGAGGLTGDPTMDWANYAKEWHAVTQTPAYQRVYDRVSELRPVATDEIVLDVGVGCRADMIARIWRQQPRKIFGIEGSQAMIEGALERLTGEGIPVEMYDGLPGSREELGAEAEKPCVTLYMGDVNTATAFQGCADYVLRTFPAGFLPISPDIFRYLRGAIHNEEETIMEAVTNLEQTLAYLGPAAACCRPGGQITTASYDFTVPLIDPKVVRADMPMLSVPFETLNEVIQSALERTYPGMYGDAHFESAKDWGFTKANEDMVRHFFMMAGDRGGYYILTVEKAQPQSQ